MKLRRLTQLGMQQLRDELSDLEQKDKKRIMLSQASITAYKTSPLSEEIEQNIIIDETKKFSSHYEGKYEVGKYLLDVFDSHRFIPDYNVWNFLSLVYYDQLLLRDKYNNPVSAGTLQGGQRMFIFEDMHKRPYHHLLRSPYMFCRAHKEHLASVKFVLAGKVHENKGVYEHIIRNDVSRIQSFLGVVKILFFNEEAGDWFNNVGSKDFGIDELIRIYKQYARAHHMPHVKAEKCYARIYCNHPHLLRIREQNHRPTNPYEIEKFLPV